MFERFTDRARRAVVSAQEEARKLQHNYIGTEHVLLGVLRNDRDDAAQMLGRLGVTYDPAETWLREHLSAIAAAKAKPPETEA